MLPSEDGVLDEATMPPLPLNWASPNQKNGASVCVDEVVVPVPVVVPVALLAAVATIVPVPIKA